MQQQFLTEAQFNSIQKHLLVKSKKPLQYPLRDILEGALYILIGGIQWRLLPSDYPPFGVVFYHFSKWKKQKVFQKLVKRLTRKVKDKLLIIDNQSISDTDLPSKDKKGYDGHKKRKGRKRCLLVDNQGVIHCVRYFPANMHDVTCAKNIIEYYKETPLGKESEEAITIYGDKGFHSPKLKEWAKRYRVNVQAIPKLKKPNLDTKAGRELYQEQSGYLVESIKKIRWVVERTFANLQKYRRLNLNYERTVSSLEAFTLLAGIRMRLRRGIN